MQLINVFTARRRRAAISRLESRSDDALTDLHTILADERSSSSEFVAAVELLREFDPSWISAVANSPRLNFLEDFLLVRLADILLSDPKGVELVVSLMQKMVASKRFDAATSRLAQLRLVLALMRSRQFEAAMKALADDRQIILESSDIVDVFNYAMSEWGHTEIAPEDLMARVLILAEADDYRSVNRHECFALAHFVCGNIHKAKQEIDQAQAKNLIARGREFSCWRYLEVSRSEMRRDLIALEQFVDGRGPGPSVFSQEETAKELFH